MAGTGAAAERRTRFPTVTATQTPIGAPMAMATQWSARPP